MDGLKARLSFDAVAYDYDDEYLTIDTDTHTININNVSRLFGVQYDGNSKLIKFRIRNKLSDVQKMQDSIVYINWIDSKGVKGQSIAINKTINNDTCEFAWKVPFDALKNSGVLHFAMSAVITEDNSSVINQKWSTQIASVITPDGIYIKSYTPSSEEEDRIAQIYNELSKMINKQSENLQSQVNSLKEDLDELGSYGTLPYKIKWEQGNVGGSNPDIYTLDRVRSETGMYYPINGTIIGKAIDNHKILLFFYDENKTFIKNTDWYDEVVYSDFGNAKYVRFQVKKSDDSNIEPNEVEDSFSYSTVVREIKESVDILNNSNSKFNSDYYVAENVNAIDGSVNEYFDAENMTENNVFSKYDTLKNTYPDYVTMKLLSFDNSDNYPIRAYYFTPPYVSVLNGNTGQVVDDKPHYNKIILTSGTHGNGPGGDNCESIVALYEFAKALCENNVDNKYLYNIRNNYQVIIVPLVNPWGVVNKSRYNSRGVDINRNFTNGWEASEHSGTKPLSEKESIAIDTLLSDNKDALFCFDVHTRGGDTFQQSYPQIMGLCTDGDDIEHLFQASIGKVKSKFDGFSGDLYRHGVFGCIRSQARYYNIHSATIECTFMAENNGQKHTALSNKVNIEMLINSIIECIKKYS